MPTFKNNPKDLRRTVDLVLAKHESHAPLLEHGVKIDVMFAYADLDERGNPKGNAITVNGVKAWGKAKIVALKDRAKGHGDAEIIIDGDRWEKITEEEQEATVDHELHHIALNKTKTGFIRRDDLDRPKLKMRKHDWQFGWFDIVAQRNGASSAERIQAKQLFEEAGQYYWPAITGMLGVALSSNVELTARVIRSK